MVLISIFLAVFIVVVLLISSTNRSPVLHGYKAFEAAMESKDLTGPQKLDLIEEYPEFWEEYQRRKLRQLHDAIDGH